MKAIKSYLSIVALMVAFTSFSMAQDLKIANFRAPDQTGINVFETPKEDVAFDGIKVRVGGNFAQQFQGLSHENKAYFEDVDGTMQLKNGLMHINPGFNLATANLNVDVQLADGIRLNMVTYLSSRHHTEAWVKGGYIQFDKLPFGSDAVDEIMKYVTIKVGHMEINYGDGHFRRSDNGNAIYNPFVGNYIMDAFNTEIGGEIYFQKDGFLAMAGMTNGEIKGDITNGSVDGEKGSIAPSILGKVGFDKQVNDDLRLRLTGSLYYTSRSVANHIYDGDRGGSRYYSVMVADGAGDNFRSGRFNPGFKSAVTSVMINPFVKVKGLEVFGLYEYAKGGTAAEAESDNLRVWNQASVEAIYRFFKNENLFLGARYNTVFEGGDVTTPQSIDRIQVGAGWFVTPNVLLKGEYVNQMYKNFPTDGLYSEGLFKGIMIEAVVGF
jgi:hypothetical protein